MTILELISLLIGFITVMLLLSVLVTALVQATQATFRLRARNLKKGILAQFDNALGGKPKDNKERVEKLLNSRGIDVMKQDTIKNNSAKRIKGPVVRVIGRLIGSAVSNIEKEELKNALSHVKAELDDEQIEKIKTGINEFWENIENLMKKRFLFIVRIISIAWAIIVAFYFQVSTPHLLNRLSIDSDFRNRLMAEAVNLTDEQGDKLDLTVEYQDISEQALLKLEKEYPTFKEKLEEVSGTGDDKAALKEELKIVIEDEGTDKERADILNSYNKILDELYEENREKSIERVQEITSRLGRINIIPWQYGDRFYLKDGALQWGNIIGVLFTAILLSFGAPFWYERLKEALRLRDMLKVKK